MKWSFATVGLVAAGLVGVVIIILFQNITVNNEEDYYLLKEISQAAMIDAIDLAHFREYGKLKIVQEKYVENFTRRFADSVNATNTSNYSLEFYNIMEYPPKASVNVSTNIGRYTIFRNSLGAAATQEYKVGNSLDSIIEIDELDKTKDDCDVKKTYYSMPYVGYHDGNLSNYEHSGAKVLGPDIEGDWHVTKIVPTGKVQMLSHVMIYDETFDENYDEIRNDWSASGVELSDYIARGEDIELTSLSVNEESTGITKVRWAARYKCRAGTTEFETYGGHVHGEKQCIIGIIYDLVWHNNECDEPE